MWQSPRASDGIALEATKPTLWSGASPEGDNGTLKESKKKGEKKIE